MKTDLFNASIEIIKKNQSKYGSFVACPNFPTYKFCWFRDGTYTAYAMDVAGELDSALRFYRWVHQVVGRYERKVKVLLEKNKSGNLAGRNDYLHTRYSLDGFEGSEEWVNKQFDGYATWLWGLTEHVKLSGDEYLIDDFSSSIGTTVTYLMKFWKEPCYDCWEEFPDKIHTNTLGSIAGSLKTINHFLKRDAITRCVSQVDTFINKKCVTKGRLAKFYNPRTKRASGIDSNLLFLDYPFHTVDANDKVFRETVRAIAKKLVNGGVHRYPQDSYYGGGEWIILTLWLARHYHEVKRREEAHKLLQWVESSADVNGELPEQVPHNLNKPKFYRRWVEKWGPIAKPLLWSHAMYIIVYNLICQ